VKNGTLYALVIAAGMLACGAVSAAQSYPTKPVRVIIPYPPGEAPDIIARLISPIMSERMGQQFVVENRAGASGQIGMQLLKDAPNDGYTIGVGQGGNLVVAPHTYKKLPYDPLKDFVPVALNATNYLAVVANPNQPFKNTAEMVAWAKANPGRLSMATNGEGGFPHLAFELFAKMADFKFLHVPYKGASQIATDVIAGQVQLGIGSYTGLLPHIQSGRVRLIGVTNPVKVPGKPELPLLADAAPGYDMRGWFGYVAPAGTPRDIAHRLNAEINRAMQQPDVTAKLTTAGLIIANETPEYFGTFLKSEYNKFGKLVKDIGLQAQ
jgi:tripartite-type tricarboxylate transporter receptor subunit TctC